MYYVQNVRLIYWSLHYVVDLSVTPVSHTNKLPELSFFTNLKSETGKAERRRMEEERRIGEGRRRE